MNFCNGCSNMYYLKIESNGESADKLIYYCRNCGNEDVNPTSENIAIWLWSRIKEKLPELSSIEVMETCTSGCTYNG